MFRSWLAVSLVFFVPLSAQAQYDLCGWPVGVQYSYYYPAPVSYYAAPQLPVAVVSAYAPLDCAAQVVVEQPIVMAYPVPVICPAPPVVVLRPAPPSGVPPARVPGTSASDTPRSQFITARYDSPTFEVYPTALPDKPQGAASCPVNVWNLTTAALVLNIDGQTATLRAGKSQTFEVNREFEWQLEGRDRQKMNIPAREKGRTIVIRR